MIGTAMRGANAAKWTGFAEEVSKRYVGTFFVFHPLPSIPTLSQTFHITVVRTKAN